MLLRFGLLYMGLLNGPKIIHSLSNDLMCYFDTFATTVEHLTQQKTNHRPLELVRGFTCSRSSDLFLMVPTTVPSNAFRTNDAVKPYSYS